MPVLLVGCDQAVGFLEASKVENLSGTFGPDQGHKRLEVLRNQVCSRNTRELVSVTQQCWQHLPAHIRESFVYNVVSDAMGWNGNSNGDSAQQHSMVG